MIRYQEAKDVCMKFNSGEATEEEVLSFSKDELSYVFLGIMFKEGSLSEFERLGSLENIENLFFKNKIIFHETFWQTAFYRCCHGLEHRAYD